MTQNVQILIECSLETEGSEAHLCKVKPNVYCAQNRIGVKSKHGVCRLLRLAEKTLNIKCVLSLCRLKQKNQ